MARRIVITGADGELGWQVFNHLSADPANEVLGLGLNPMRRPEIVTCDLTEPRAAWAHHFECADALIHFAGDRRPQARWDTLVPLNLDMMMNVCGVAAAKGTRRLVLASSNFVLGGYRFTSARLTAEVEPTPVAGYGATKLFAERFGAFLAEQYGVSVVALRIGYAFATAEDSPPADIGFGRWGAEMWLSRRDLCAGVERAVLADVSGLAVVPLVSRNAGSRWDLDHAARTIGYVPEDGMAPAPTAGQRLRAGLAWMFRFALPAASMRLAGRMW